MPASITATAAGGYRGPRSSRARFREILAAAYSALGAAPPPTWPRRSWPTTPAAIAPGSNSASLVSAGYNLTNDTTGTACGFTTALDLVNKNPALGALASNGGPTKTMLPATSSPAADVIPNPTTLDGFEVCPGTDQRGATRPGNGESRCTIGAVEVSGPKATTSQVTAIPATVTAGTRVAFLIVVKPTSGTGTPTGSVTFTIGSTKLCSAVLSGGDAACGATNAPVGTDTVTGTYSGGGGYAASSGTTTLTVN